MSDRHRTAMKSQADEILALLIEAGPILASSLDYETTLQRVVRLVVPRLCDGCIIDIEQGGSFVPAAMAHVDPEKEALIRELRRRFPLSLADTTPGSRAFRTEEPVMLGETTEEVVRAAARNPDHARLIHALGMKYVFSAPLVARGKIIGVMTLTYDSAERRPFDQDMPLLQDLATRVALAVDNARLHTEAETARAQYGATLESITDPFFLVDSDWRFVYVNQAAADNALNLHGKSKEELVGKLLWEAIPVLAGTPIDLELHRAQAERIPVDLEFLSPVSARWYEVRAFPAAAGLAVHSRDITDRKHYQEDLEAALNEKVVLLKEIHHRVKNNLQIVSSLLSLQLQRVHEATAAGALKESGSRIRAIALVHEKLYRSSDIARVDFGPYVEELASQLRQLYLKDAGRVDLRVRIRELCLEIDTAIPCGLIANELITNALQHAFPGGQEGQVLVEVGEEPTGEGRLSVGDNGVGMPEKLPDNPPHLGLELVQSLVQQIRGSLLVERGTGTRFIVTFPRKGAGHD